MIDPTLSQLYNSLTVLLHDWKFPIFEYSCFTCGNILNVYEWLLFGQHPDSCGSPVDK